MAGRAVRQDQLLAILDEAGDRAVPLEELLVRLYGRTGRRATAAFRAALHRIREARPGLQIDCVHGYRLRRPSPRVIGAGQITDELAARLLPAIARGRAVVLGVEPDGAVTLRVPPSGIAGQGGG